MRAAVVGAPSSTTADHRACSAVTVAVVTVRARPGSSVATSATPSRAGQRAAANPSNPSPSSCVTLS